MHTVVAAGLIRETARLIQTGVDMDAAIQSVTKGSSREIREAYVEFIQEHTPRVRKVTQETVRLSILRAASSLCA